MKKVLVILLAIVALSSCTGGKSIHIPIKEGDTRTTETEEYIVVERCTGTTGFGYGNPIWEFESVTKKENE